MPILQIYNDKIKFKPLPLQKMKQMKTKQDIVENWLPRYTGTQLDEFGQYILLTNFQKYVEMFSEMNGVEIKGIGKPMPSATAKGITIINFGMGSRQCARAVYGFCLSSNQYAKALAAFYLGKCGRA